MVLLWLGIQPQTREDQERPGVALQRLLADDPSLVVKTGADGTVMIGAPSEDQLDAAVNQLVHRFDVDAAIKNIEIAFKETVTRAAEGESTYALQSSGGVSSHVLTRDRATSVFATRD
jgi:elongation factor G